MQGRKWHAGYEYARCVAKSSSHSLSLFLFLCAFNVREISSFGFSGRGADRNIVSSLLIRSQLVGGCPFPFKAIDVRRIRQLEDPWNRAERSSRNNTGSIFVFKFQRAHSDTRAFRFPTFRRTNFPGCSNINLNYN